MQERIGSSRDFRARAPEGPYSFWQAAEMPRELPGRLLWLRRIARGLYYITKSSFKYCNRVWAKQSVRSTLGVQQLVPKLRYK